MEQHEDSIFMSISHQLIINMCSLPEKQEQIDAWNVKLYMLSSPHSPWPGEIQSHKDNITSVGIHFQHCELLARLYIPGLY